MENEALNDLWAEVSGALPDRWKLGGVVYHGPDRDPGTAWVAFVTDPAGTPGGPEGVGPDPIAALRSLKEAAARD